MGALIDLSKPHVKRRLLVLLALLVICWVFWTSRSALTPFFVGALFAYLLLPVVRFFDNVLPIRGRFHRLKRPVSIVATYLLMLAIFFVIGLYFIPPLVDQTTEFVNDLPEYWEAGRAEFDDINTFYEETVPESMQQQIQENLGAVGSQLSAGVSSALMATFSAVGTVVGLAAGLALLPLWLFYVLKDHERGMARFYNLFPEDWRPDVRNIVIIVDGILGSYVRVQLFLGVIIGVVTGVAMWLIGINQSLVLGLMAGFFELIPVLGPWMAFIVAAIVTLATEPDKLPLVAIAFLGIQQLENTFLVPKLQGDAVRVNPAVVMILLVVGGTIWGLVGMIVIIPVAAVLRDIFVYLYDRTSQDRPPADPLESIKH